jgi:tetratricopeptide (TPR) repeat protein
MYITILIVNINYNTYMNRKHEKTASFIPAFIPQSNLLVKFILTIVMFLLLTITASARLTDWEDLIDLSITLYQQGEYSAALKTMKESIEVAKTTFGPNHNTVTISMKNLALLYSFGGNYSEAESLYKKALSLEEKILGSDHLFVAEDLKTLAELYRYQGKDKEAEFLYKRAHAIEEKYLITGQYMIVHNLGLKK